MCFTKCLSTCVSDKPYPDWKCRRRPFIWCTQNANEPNIRGGAMEKSRRQFGPNSVMLSEYRTSETLINLSIFDIFYLTKNHSQLLQWRYSKRSPVLRRLSPLRREYNQNKFSIIELPRMKILALLLLDTASTMVYYTINFWGIRAVA